MRAKTKIWLKVNALSTFGTRINVKIAQFPTIRLLQDLRIIAYYNNILIYLYYNIYYILLYSYYSVYIRDLGPK